MLLSVVCNFIMNKDVRFGAQLSEKESENLSDSGSVCCLPACLLIFTLCTLSAQSGLPSTTIYTCSNRLSVHAVVQK